MAFEVKGKVFRSYYDEKYRDMKHEFCYVSQLKDRSHAIEQAREYAQKQYGWCARITEINQVGDILPFKHCPVDLDKPWWDYPIYVFDVETTGLDEVDDRIVELGIAKYNNEERCFEPFKNFLLSSEVPIPQSLIDKGINDITNEMLVGKPTFEEIRGEIDEIFLDHENIFIAQNRGFDYSFLAESYRRSGDSIAHMRLVCSMELSMRTHPEWRYHNLRLNRERVLGLKDEQSHRAAQDAVEAGNIFLALARENQFFRRPRTMRQFLDYFDRVDV